MGTCCLRSMSLNRYGIGMALSALPLISPLRLSTLLSLPLSSNFHHSSSSPSQVVAVQDDNRQQLQLQQEEQQQQQKPQLRSTQLVAFEYADLNLPYNLVSFFSSFFIFYFPLPLLTDNTISPVCVSFPFFNYIIFLCPISGSRSCQD